MRINRLLQIVLLLNTEKEITVRYLSDHLSVSRKTIYKDLEILNTSGIPIVYGDNSKGIVKILEGFKLMKAFGIEDIPEEDLLVEKVYNRHVDNSTYDHKMLVQWENFTNNRKVESNEIQPEILHSWLRCKQLGISIHEVGLENLLRPEELVNYDIENNLPESILESQWLAGIANKLNLIVNIYNKEKKLIQIINPMKDYDQIYPNVGYNKDASESEIGTNAVSLAIDEGKPIMLLGADHYKTCFHSICCVAVPYYYEGEVAGALNVAFIHKKVNPRVIEHIKGYTRLYEGLILNVYEEAIKEERIMQSKTFEKKTGKERVLFGKSSYWKELIEIAQHLSKMRAHILIQGEKGVGKTSVARLIHDESARKHGPFIVGDCSQINKEEALRTFFGSEKSVQGEVGLIEEANGGSLVVKNPQMLEPVLQKRLAKYIVSGTLTRIGSKKQHRFDTRVLVLIDEGSDMVMLGDLQKAVSLLCVNIRPLKERKEDISAIVEGYLEEGIKSKQMNKQELKSLVTKLQRKEWSENVRSLQAYLQQLENN